MHRPTAENPTPLHTRVATALVALTVVVAASAQRPADENARFLTVGGSLTSAQKSRLADEIADAAGSGVETLFLEIQPGQSEFPESYGVAERLSKVAGSVKRTVAFVPQPLRGHAVLIALAADEIVLAPDAGIGDAFAGQPVDPDLTQRTAYQEIATRKGHSTALVRGMIDRNVQLVSVTTPAGKRIVTGEELAQRRGELEILDEQVVKPAGSTLFLEAEQAKAFGLVQLIEASRKQLVLDYGYAETVAAADPLRGEVLKPALLKLEGTIDGRTHQYVARRLQQAKSERRDLLFVEVESNSGDPASAAAIARLLDGFPGRTVAWVPRAATGAASLIPFGCDEMVVGAEARIGSFGDDGWAEGDQQAYAATASEWVADGKFPEALVRGLIDPSLKVVEVKDVDNPGVRALRLADGIDDPKRWQVVRTVKPEGQILTLTGPQAAELGLARPSLVDDVEQLQEAYQIPGGMAVLEPGWVDALVALLTSGTGTVFLIVIGLVCLYVEINMPGIGIAGLIAALCFVLFFWSRYLSDMANTLEIVLFLMGLVFLVIELFVLPGFGLAGITGVLLVLTSLVLACQSFTLPSSPAETRLLLQNVGSIAGAGLLFVVAAVTLARFLPTLPMFSRMMLAPPELEEMHDLYESGLAEVADATEGLAALVGRHGVAASPLRPSGRMQLDGRYYDVVARGGFIEPGAPVEVLEVYPTRIVVGEPA